MTHSDELVERVARAIYNARNPPTPLRIKFERLAELGWHDELAATRELARASLTQPNRTCDDCEFVGPIQYARGERRCDFLRHRSAPEWIMEWLNYAPRPRPNYGPNTRADECGAFEPSTQDQP